MAFNKLINFDFVFRKKQIDARSVEESKLARVLNTFDLTCLGLT